MPGAYQECVSVDKTHIAGDVSWSLADSVTHIRDGQ
mgnify:CR=1 FL=1